MDFYAYQMNWYLAWNLESKQDTKLQPHLKWMRAALNVYKYVHFYSVSKINCVFFYQKQIYIFHRIALAWAFDQPGKENSEHTHSEKYTHIDFTLQKEKIAQ